MSYDYLHELLLGRSTVACLASTCHCSSHRRTYEAEIWGLHGASDPLLALEVRRMTKT
jgi:hypothetical protein